VVPVVGAGGSGERERTALQKIGKAGNNMWNAFPRLTALNRAHV